MIRRRRVTNDPSRDVPRSIDTARESKKKSMPPRSHSYLVRTLKCVRVRGGFVSGAGKCGEARAGAAGTLDGGRFTLKS